MPHAAEIHTPDVTPERVAADIVNLLAGIERVGTDAPAAIAFRMAIARKGRELTAARGTSALAEALAQVRATTPDRAEPRTAVLEAAWAGLAGWKP